MLLKMFLRGIDSFIHSDILITSLSQTLFLFCSCCDFSETGYPKGGVERGLFQRHLYLITKETDADEKEGSFNEEGNNGHHIECKKCSFYCVWWNWSWGCFYVPSGSSSWFVAVWDIRRGRCFMSELRSRWACRSERLR